MKKYNLIFIIHYLLTEKMKILPFPYEKLSQDLQIVGHEFRIKSSRWDRRKYVLRWVGLANDCHPKLNSVTQSTTTK